MRDIDLQFIEAMVGGIKSMPKRNPYDIAKDLIMHHSVNRTQIGT